jgi:hypothetical protein
MEDDEFNTFIRNAIISQRKLAVSMLEGFEANAFEKPATKKDLTYWKKVIADCDAKLAGLEA